MIAILHDEKEHTLDPVASAIDRFLMIEASLSRKIEQNKKSFHTINSKGWLNPLDFKILIKNFQQPVTQKKVKISLSVFTPQGYAAIGMTLS